MSFLFGWISRDKGNKVGHVMSAWLVNLGTMHGALICLGEETIKLG